jgi:hypothetical protein
MEFHMTSMDNVGRDCRGFSGGNFGRQGGWNVTRRNRVQIKSTLLCGDRTQVNA